MEILKSINLVVSFLLELCALAAFAYWGFRTGGNSLLRFVFGIGAPVLAAITWGIFGAPRSRFHLTGAAYQGFGLIFFGLAAIALYAAGQRTMAIVFIIIVIINRALVVLWKQ